jgi:hypothetical protein
MKNLNGKLISLKIWQGVTILTCLYLLVIAFMQYNWYPDSQTTTYNSIMGLVFLFIIVVRLLKPKIKTIPILIILDIALFTIASRAFLNINFWQSIFSLVTSKPGLIIFVIFVADYYLRFSYFNYHGQIEKENS